MHIPGENEKSGLPTAHVPFSFVAPAAEDMLMDEKNAGKEKLRRGYSVVKVDPPHKPPEVQHHSGMSPSPWVHPARRDK